MIRTAFLAVAVLCALTINAEARQRHKVVLADPGCGVIFPCEGVTASPRGEYIARSGFGTAQKVYKPRAEAGRIRQNRVARARAVQTETASYGAPSPSVGYSIGRPVRYIAGRLICALNVGAALAERGIKGTGSALALSYLHWGRSAGGPVPGAVIVSSRRGGGHVAIVSRVEGGIVYAWNATGGQSGWREILYRHRVIDYRVPS